VNRKTPEQKAVTAKARRLREKATHTRRYKEDPAYREYHRARAREGQRRVRLWLARYKVDRGCADCGYRADPAALDFDHTDGKTRPVSFTNSIAQAVEEIRKHKCEVVCSNCHRIRTVRRRNADPDFLLDLDLLAPTAPVKW
jgi:hypothetical protein